MWWRIFYGTLRTILGLVFLELINVPFTDILYKIFGYELAEDPADILFSTINSFLQLHPFSVTYFLSIYLIFWGILEIFLSINLLRHKLWVFPVSLYLIVFFVIYELFRFFHTHSIILLLIIVVDIVIFWLIKNEYQKVTTTS